MKTLAQISKFLNIVILDDSTNNMQFNDIYLDSQQVASNSIFIAIQGQNNHGIDYLQQVIKAGAKIVFTDKPFLNKTSIKVIYVKNLVDKLASFSNWFYNYPSKDMQVIGVTGTNGKTSVTHYAAQLCSKYYKTAILGTLGNGVVGKLVSSANTTLDTVALNRTLANLNSQKVKIVLMEVSSHAIALGRVVGIEFSAVALTQVTRDHLDFHGTIEVYHRVKQDLFTKYNAKIWILNIDDKVGIKLNAMQPPKVNIIRYAIKNKALINASNIQLLATGIVADINILNNKFKLTSSLFGKFNIENLMCVIGICQSLALPIDKIIKQMTSLKAISGRMEVVLNQPVVIIDYAHTPDALESILKAVKLHLNKQKLWLVFGCGGDRDTGKRPLMANIACQYADEIILTDDNPRFELPANIITDIMSGIDTSFKNIQCIHDRQQAINLAIKSANVDDVIIIAGKGHENYQDIKGVKYSMSDAKIVKDQGAFK